MKAKLIFIFSILILTSEINTAQSISNPNGFKIRTGVNLAIWLSQSDKRGAEREKFITEKDIELLSNLGFDHVRLPIDEEQIWDEEGNFHPEAVKLMHNAINWSTDRGMRVIVDLHIIRSHYFNAASNALWTDPAEQKKLVKLWVELSAELKKYPTSLVAYELMNEAVADNHDDWNKLIAMLVASLRKAEPERTIVIGSNKWQGTETFPYLKVPENDPNIILSFHHYRPFGFTHYKTPWTQLNLYDGPVHYPGEVITKEDQAANPDYIKTIQWAIGKWDKEVMLKDISVAIKTAKKMGLPLYCGEFGVYYTAPKADALRWYSDVTDIFRENNIAYSHWDYKTTFGIIDKNGKPDMPVIDLLVKSSK
ncbi:MAG: cellulase family glycosylhydrolase [Prolixibacteraceae bacterium]|nr:cellulase family glycosylhydrolase [Prolixibacteraceae bacterium]MBN2772730.1 cellulase family glycosylhydrolase [Prolixibacteraceae bacterium]